MKQIFAAASPFEIICLRAGILSGDYDVDEHVSERILLVINTASVIELTPNVVDLPGVAPLMDVFDRAIDLNATLDPVSPFSFAPKGADLPIWERLLRSYWKLGDENIELVLESPQVNPGIALGRIFHNARLRIHSDGLMTYGPSRNKAPLSMRQRMATIHYLPLVPEVQPLAYTESGAALREVDADSFSESLATYVTSLRNAGQPILSNDPAVQLPGGATAVAVGQYLAPLGLMTEEEEDQLHVQMAEDAAKAGAETLIFKPHPKAPPTSNANVGQAAERRGMRFILNDTPVIAEALYAYVRPDIVIGCFSTSLATAELLGVPDVRAVGTQQVLAQLTPYQNANRIPATITDARYNPAAPDTSVSDLITAVSFVMQPEIRSDLRDEAHRIIDGLPEQLRTRYFRRRRLTASRMPGGTRTVKNRAVDAARDFSRIGTARVKQTIKRKAMP
ncbi:polysialyltransferase family glycosyltransferase [Brevibacterium luteolum]|uniref:polysialyltransferase family glycosyltransferase n=1 Tax=Brevibacterium luteolum TaxID=199591 RepID=UPI0038792125